MPDPDLTRTMVEVTDLVSARDAARCAVTGCARPVKARGWCDTHYTRWRRTGDPGPALIRARGTDRAYVCTVEGCTKPHHARGLCHTHYTQQRKTGTTTRKRPARRTLTRHARGRITALTTTDPRT